MLEITDLDGPPAYAAINESSQTILTVTAIQRSGYWRRPGSDAPSALTLNCQQKDNTVSIDVSITDGQRTYRRRQQASALQPTDHIGTFNVELGKSISLQDLGHYGFEPVFIKVVTAKGPDEVPVKIENKTKAVDVIGVDEVKGNCLLTIKNASSKKLIALTVRMPLDGGQPDLKVDGGQTIAGGLLGNESSSATVIKSKSYVALEWTHGQPGFLPGQQYKVLLPVTRTGSITPQGFSADDKAPRVVITGLVFDDSTFEGDADTALRLAADKQGRKIQLMQVLSLIQGAIDDHRREDFEILENLWMKGAALREDPDKRTLNEITKNFPPLTKLQKVEVKFWLYSALEGVKRSLLIDIRRRETQQDSTNDFRDWLSNLKRRYESRLQKM
ncbi:MAG TPA: hypothetical protein VFC63_14910 [Blastocatellia bacterium]|nr:hypothetical protein [Blastocatellia bacterium]